MIAEQPSFEQRPSFEDRAAAALRDANLLALQRPSYIDFWRAVFAPQGIVDVLFPTRYERERFEATAACRQCLVLLGRLRTANDRANAARMITVRLPADLHEVLKADASERQVSLNRHCLDKLMAPLPAAV
jgi:hypothetical protein